MADDVTVDNGGLTDYVVATDDIGSSRQAQLVKLLYSANGDATAITADSLGLLVRVGSGNVDIAGQLEGFVAEDDPMSGGGNSVPVGVRAHSGVPTAMSASNDIVVPWANLNGAITVIPRIDQLPISATPTIDTAVYAAGDRLGSVMTFAAAAIGNGRTGSVVQAQLTDKANSVFDIDLVLFSVTPTLVNADNGVFDMTDANKDTAGPLPWINFSTANSYSYGTSNRDVIGTYLGGPCDVRYKCASGDTALYGVLVARGAYDAASTTDLICTITVVRD